MYGLSNECVHKLLDLYKYCECLWNKEHKNYANRGVRNLALKKIQILLNEPKLTVNEVRKKLGHMKSDYQKDVKNNSGRKAFWFKHADSFLRPHWATSRQEEIYKLLDLYKCFECLWNKNHKKYYDEDIRKLALKEIAIQMNWPVDYVKSKTKNILTAYMSVLKGKRKKQYWFDHADAFIRPQQSTAEDTVLKEEYEMDIEETVIVKQEVEDYNDDNCEINFENVFVKEEVDVHTEDNKQHNEQQNGDVEGRLIDDVPRTSNCLIDTCNGTNRNIVDTSKKNIKAKFIKPVSVKNKLDKFGRIMIDYLREMPPKRQLRCQAEIESIMLRFRTENLMNTEDF